MASRMYSTRLRQPSRSRTVAAILPWKPWQLMQSLTSTFLPRASGRSWMPCRMEISVQRTMPFCSAKSCDDVLVGGELDAALGIGPEARRPDRQAIVARRQVLDDVFALIIGQHADRHLHAGMAGLHKRRAERRAVGSGHGAGNRRGIGRGDSKNESEYSQAERVSAWRFLSSFRPLWHGIFIGLGGAARRRADFGRSKRHAAQCTHSAPGRSASQDGSRRC